MDEILESCLDAGGFDKERVSETLAYIVKPILVHYSHTWILKLKDETYALVIGVSDGQNNGWRELIIPRFYYGENLNVILSYLTSSTTRQQLYDQIINGKISPQEERKNPRFIDIIKINEYFKEEDTSPLHFFKIPIKIEREFKKIDDLSLLIEKVLALTAEYSSIDDKGNYQCDWGKFRSSGDIWRHVKQVKPKTSIFEVLACLYDLDVKKVVRGQICNLIHKRVFKLGTNGSYRSDGMDEYGISSRSGWKNIDKIYKEWKKENG